MQLHSIKSKAGAVSKRKRVGRGNSAGQGTYCGRGIKGQLSRKSGRKRAGFEGGQTPLVMRLPKLKGFKSPSKIKFQVVNVSDLDRFNDGDEVNILTLLEKKLVRKKSQPVKVLGNGKITKKLNVKVHKISAAAKEKIAAAGGKVI